MIRVDELLLIQYSRSQLTHPFVEFEVTSLTARWSEWGTVAHLFTLGNASSCKGLQMGMLGFSNHSTCFAKGMYLNYHCQLSKGNAECLTDITLSLTIWQINDYELSWSPVLPNTPSSFPILGHFFLPNSVTDTSVCYSLILPDPLIGTYSEYRYKIDEVHICLVCWSKLRDWRLSLGSAHLCTTSALQTNPMALGKA